MTSSLGVSNKRQALFQMSHAGIHHTLKFFMKFLNANMDGRFSKLQGIDGVCINIYGFSCSTIGHLWYPCSKMSASIKIQSTGLLFGLDGSIDAIHNGWSLIKDQVSTLLTKQDLITSSKALLFSV